MTIKIEPGQQIYKFHFIEKLGAGAFGEVWKAFDKNIDKLIAVKILCGDQTSVDERLYEAKIGSKLEHINLVNVHGAESLTIKNESYIFIAMDYLPDGSIVKKLNSRNFLPVPIAINYIRNILCGLEYLHEMDFYHNDIKPQNILIGTSNQAVLSDYGISCMAPSHGCPTSHRGFYKPHAAPETLQSQVIDVQTDVYQVGLTLFRLLNGLGILNDIFSRCGEENYNALVMEGHLIPDTLFAPYIPTSLKTVIKKAIESDPQKRYQSALDMRRALEKLCYPGYWTSDDRGEFIGLKGHDQYFFEITRDSAVRYNFTAIRKNTISLRETKVLKFCKTGISITEVRKLQKRFMHSVMEE